MSKRWVLNGDVLSCVGVKLDHRQAMSDFHVVQRCVKCNAILLVLKFANYWMLLLHSRVTQVQVESQVLVEHLVQL